MTEIMCICCSSFYSTEFASGSDEPCDCGRCIGALELITCARSVIAASKDPRMIAGPLSDRIHDLEVLLNRIEPPNTAKETT